MLVAQRHRRATVVQHEGQRAAHRASGANDRHAQATQVVGFRRKTHRRAQQKAHRARRGRQQCLTLAPSRDQREVCGGQALDVFLVSDLQQGFFGVEVRGQRQFQHDAVNL